MRPTRRTILTALALVIVAIASLPYVLDPPARDQGVFAVIGWRWLSGDCPYLMAGVEHKGPLPFAAYALAFRLFGLDMSAARLGAWIAGLVTAFLLVAVTRRVMADAEETSAPSARRSVRRWNEGLPALAGVLYLAVIGHGGLSDWWSGAQAEAFMEPFAVGAVLLALAAGPGRWNALAAGALLGLATLGKPTALLLAPLIGLALARRRPRWIELAGGVLLPWALAFGYFGCRGAAGALADNVFAANLDYGGQGLRQLPRMLHAFIVSHGVVIPRLLVVPAAAGALALVRRPGGWLAPAWLAVAWLEVLVQGRMFGYHFVPVAAPLLALAVAGVRPLLDGLRPISRVAGAIAGLCLILAVARLPWGETTFRWRHAAGAIDPETFLAHFAAAPSTDIDPRQTAAAAAWASGRLAPNEPLLVWGFEPTVCFLARRRPASRYLYDYFLTSPDVAAGRQARDRQRFLDDLRQNPPGAVMVIHDDTNPIERVDSARQLAGWPALAGWLQAGYEPAGRVGDFEFFTRRR